MEEQELRDLVGQQLFDIAVRILVVYHRFLKDKDLLDEVMKPPYKDEWDHIKMTSNEMVGLMKVIDRLHGRTGKHCYKA